MCLHQMWSDVWWNKQTHTHTYKYKHNIQSIIYSIIIKSLHCKLICPGVSVFPWPPPAEHSTCCQLSARVSANGNKTNFASQTQTSLQTLTLMKTHSVISTRCPWVSNTLNPQLISFERHKLTHSQIYTFTQVIWTYKAYPQHKELSSKFIILK